MAVDLAKTYHGRPCKEGHTLRQRSNGHCIACSRERTRLRAARRRLDHITYFTDLLKNRRYKALKRREARNG